MYLLAFVTMIVQGSQMGSRVVATLLALELDTSKWMIGLLIASYSFLPLLLAIHSGRVADRMGTRRPMLFGIGFMSIGLLVPFMFPTLPGLFVSATMVGLGFTFYNVSSQSLAGQYGPKAERTRNFATLSLGYSASNLIGPVSAGYLIEWYGHSRASGVLAATMLFALIVLYFSRSLNTTPMLAGSGKPRSSFDLLANPELRKILIASALIVTGWDLFTFYVPIYGHNIQLSPAEIGKILGAFAIGGFVMRACLGPLTTRFRVRPVLMTAMFFGAAIYVVFPFIEDYTLLLLVALLAGAALGTGQPLTLAMVFNRCPEGRAGEVTGLRLAINNMTHVIVPAGAGVVGTLVGVAPVFVLASVFLLVGGLLSRRA
jgi:MFS family permease